MRKPSRRSAGFKVCQQWYAECVRCEVHRSGCHQSAIDSALYKTVLQFSPRPGTPFCTIVSAFGG
eukprot:2504041-Lingulodinium_polyedra.AAC.1